MNPIAVSVLVFFVAFQAIYLYMFTQAIQNVSVFLVILVSALFALVSGYAEYEWSRGNNESEEEQENEVKK